MTGAEALLRAARAAGVEVCFANPGTTELDLVRAMDAAGGIRPILGLFEGVCSGAADGYARMAGRPALTLLHLGPGLANAGANLHNARKGRTPMVVLVGDHAISHKGRGAPLESDIETLAYGVSDWVRTSPSAAVLAEDLTEAFEVACGPPGKVATLIVPADCAWEDTATPPAATRPPSRAWGATGDAAVQEAAGALADPGGAALLLGGTALTERGLLAAGRIRAATGCRLVCETFPARMERGGGLPAPQKLPYFPDEATAALEGNGQLVLAGAPAPVAFFKYPGVASEIAPPGMALHSLAAPDEHDAADALERLAERLAGGDPKPSPGVERPPAGRGSGPLTPEALALTVAAAQPHDAIVVDEGLTLSEPYFAASAASRRHTYLALTGGAIGYGPPAATGAAVACPERPVVLLQADGSGMYTLQALWTQAHERLNVTTVICANRSYRILQYELLRAGLSELPPAARAFTGLGDPAPDWTALAHGMGVAASRAETTDELSGQMARALHTPGPHLVEALIRD